MRRTVRVRRPAHGCVCVPNLLVVNKGEKPPRCRSYCAASRWTQSDKGIREGVQEPAVADGEAGSSGRAQPSIHPCAFASRSPIADHVPTKGCTLTVILQRRFSCPMPSSPQGSSVRFSVR